ncbi:MAG: ATP-binding cassette domain-containing protein [Eubacteriaceae bacterium]|nr:ATP-binding cassette domain-containing protein [Eubacteriaceae bacterium]
MSDLLKIENVSYQYDGKYRALNNVSVSFAEGELVAVLGSNGAGKSTFFLCCNGVLKLQSGKIVYNGVELKGNKKDTFTLRQAVGLVFQDPDSQIIAGTVESEVSFGPLNLELSKEEVEKRVEESLVQMDILRYRDYAPHYLSGGEKKRVSIADILAMQPSIILLDEPTASLDPQNTDALEHILLALNESGITIILSTHDVNFAYRIANRAIVFADGEIIADANVDEVFSQEDTLKKAGLKKPLLYEAFEHIQKAGLCKRSEKKPRTIEEFAWLMGDADALA